jgi:protein-disulfide isomerase
MMNRRLLLSTGAAALFAGTGLFMSRKDGSPLLVGMANAQEGEAPEITEMVLGDPDAAVEVIEYASFTCPHCATFHAGQFKQLKENYIDTGLIRFVYRDVYFDRFGLWASMVARCGGNTDRFFAVVDQIYENQSEWTSSGDPAVMVEELKKYGKIAGMDSADLDACMSDAAYAQGLVEWYEANAEADGIRSTPSFIIDGESHSNMSYDDFAAILDEKLAG